MTGWFNMADWLDGNPPVLTIEDADLLFQARGRHHRTSAFPRTFDALPYVASLERQAKATKESFMQIAAWPREAKRRIQGAWYLLNHGYARWEDR